MLGKAASPVSHGVTAKLAILSALKHGSGDHKQYYGNEPVSNGQPVVDVSGGLQVDSSGSVIVYDQTLPACATLAAAEVKHESFFFIPDASVHQRIHLNAVPIPGPPVGVGTGQTAVGL